MKKAIVLLAIASIFIVSCGSKEAYNLEVGKMTVIPGFELKPDNLEYSAILQDFLRSDLDEYGINLFIGKGTGMNTTISMDIPEIAINSGKFNIDTRGILIKAVVRSTLPLSITLIPSSEGSVCECSPKIKEGDPGKPETTEVLITVHCDQGLRSMKTIDVYIDALRETDSSVKVTSDMGVSIRITSIVATEGLDISLLSGK